MSGEAVLKDPSDLSVRLQDRNGDEWAMTTEGVWSCLTDAEPLNQKFLRLRSRFGPLKKI